MDPLLLSVRSGAASMPGMLDTILNVGLDDQTTAGLGRQTGNLNFATDCRRRLVEMFETSVGGPPPTDPKEQLREAVEAVFRSWGSPRACAYRAADGISDDLGTAVNVQLMVFGNRGEHSGTGVVFSRDPSTGETRLYGDVLFGAQGEDVVAGTHATHPIDDLDDVLPEVAKDLRTTVARLERHFTDLVDVEFTIEEGRLWWLQVRVGKRSPAAALRIAVDLAEDPSFPLGRTEAVDRVAHLLEEPPTTGGSVDERAPSIGTGLGASPGVAIGRAVFSSESAVASEEPTILIRSETSPEDVEGMAAASGILTANGGLASHAAVVAPAGVGPPSWARRVSTWGLDGARSAGSMSSLVTC